MTELTLWDHLLALAVVVVYPLYSWKTFPDFARSVREAETPADRERAKIAGYRSTILAWLGFFAALTAIWIALGRSPAILGLRESSPERLAAGVLLSLGLFWLHRRQWVALAARDEPPQKIVEQLGDLATFMPRSPRELNWFRAVSVNAGVTEELLYRGFFIAYLEPLVGLPVAAILSVVVFTLGHAYQGLEQLVPIGFASASVVVLYLVSGSLWLPILLHAGLDWYQGGQLARLLRLAPPVGRPAAEPA